MSNLQIYVCDKCENKSLFRINLFISCSTPNCRNKMTSDIQKYCNYCSASKQICCYCGSHK